MRRHTAAATALTAGVLLVSLTACQAEPPARALRYGGDAVDLCVPTPAGRQLTYANDAVENTSGDAITIEKVSLVGAHDARAVDAYLAPIVDRTLIGTVPGWPPVEQASTAFDNKVALPAPLASRESANLVVHLDAGEGATVQAVEVTYRQRGHNVTARNSTSLSLKRTC